MTEETHEDPADAGNLTADEAGEIVRSLGTIFSNAFLYGPEHGVTVKAVQDAYAIFQVVFGRGSDVSFNLVDDELIVNRMTLELKNPLIRMFAAHMSDLELSSFTINHELTWDDFLKLVNILNQKPADLLATGGFAAALQAEAVKGVITKTVVYKAVTEEEVVVNKDVLDAAGEGGLGDGSEESVLAFLEGDTTVSKEDATKGLVSIAEDAQAISNLVLKAAEEQQEEAKADGDDAFSSIVVGCLRKAYDLLAQDKSAKTQKGKKNLQRVLKLVEKEILDKLQTVTEGASIEDAFVSDAVEEMADELKIDGLASDYMKKRTAIDSNEKRILRFIRAKGLDRIEDTDLQERLFAGGLDMDGWRELLAKSGIEKGGVGSGAAQGDGLEAMGHLAVLLHEMEHSIGGAGGESSEDGALTMGAGIEGLDKVAASVQKEIQGLVQKTEKKIRDLVENMQRENEAEAKGEPVPTDKKMPRAKLMELLAEIGQELCQPLTVINCSVDMIRGGGLGEVSSTQGEMLSLAAESGAKLETLINKLVQISGVPETRSPDASIQQALYT